MANPFHDEAGRFTSKEEMGAAVDRLYANMASAKNPVERAEASEAWFNLRTEYEAAQKAEASSDAVGAFIADKTEAKRSGRPALVDIETSGMHEYAAAAPTLGSAARVAYTESKGAEEIWREEYAEARKGDFANLNEHQLNTLAKMLKSKNAPQVLREDFYQVAPAEVKVAVMEKYMGHPLDGVRVPASLAHGLLENDGLHNDTLVAHALSSDMPFEDRVELADATGRLSYLAAGRPSAFTENDHLETALISELRRRGRNGDINREVQGGWAALASNSKRRSTIDEVFEKFGSFDNYDPKVISELAQNPNLNPDRQAELLQSIAWNDAQSFGPLAGRVAGSAYKVKTPERKERSERLFKVVNRYTEIVKGADSSAFLNLDPMQLRSARSELQRLEGIGSPSNEVKARIAHFEAVLDAQDGEYNGLKRHVATNEEQLKKKYVEADHFANERLKRRLSAATAVRAADIAAGEYAERYYAS